MAAEEGLGQGGLVRGVVFREEKKVERVISGRVEELLALFKFFPNLPHVDRVTWAADVHLVLDPWHTDPYSSYLRFEAWAKDCFLGKFFKRSGMVLDSRATVYGAKAHFKELSPHLESVIHFAASVEVGYGTQLAGPLIVGKGVHIGRSVMVEQSVLGEGVIIEPGALVQSSLIGPGCLIGARSVLADNAWSLGDWRHCKLVEHSFHKHYREVTSKELCPFPRERFGTVLGPRVTVGPGCVFEPGVIIEGGSRVKAGSVLKSGYYPRAFFEDKDTPL